MGNRGHLGDDVEVAPGPENKGIRVTRTGGKREVETILDELLRKLERVQEDDPHAWVFISAYYRGSKKPDDFLTFDPSAEGVGGHLDDIAHQAKQHGSGVAELALANMNVHLLNGFLELGTRYTAVVRDPQSSLHRTVFARKDSSGATAVSAL